MSPFLLQSFTFAGLLHNIWALAAGLIGIGFLIGFHELGHFLFCKLFGIKTPSFSIGMGPKILSKKIGDTDFSLSLIPLGGYVEIAGAPEPGQGDQKEAYSEADDSFAQKPLWQKVCVMLGGILFNIIFTYFALAYIFYHGVPQTPILYPRYASLTVAEVKEASPAQQSGLQAGDIITAVNHKAAINPMDVITVVRQHPNQVLPITLTRNNAPQTINITVGSQPGPQEGTAVGFLGVDFAPRSYSLMQAFSTAGQATWYLTKEIGNAFKKIFFKGEVSSLGGPLAVIAQTVKGAKMGFSMFLLLLAFISLNLALLNLIPLPVFDGGQFLYYAIEAITRRPLSDKTREYIGYVNWVFLLGLIGLLTLRDLWGFFGK